MPLARPTPIETGRLRVRLAEESDLPALLEVNGDAEVTRFLPYATWDSPAAAQGWFKRMADLQATGTALQFVVADKDCDKAMGTCLIFRHDEGSARAELGFVLGRKHWGGGYMTEALTALVDRAFDGMALRRLEAEANPLNIASGRLLRRLGFVREGLLRQRWVSKGAAYDVEAYGLLHGDWTGGRG
ncbi:MAG TPA: GNAT family N-acetyltransferase [Usitatibacter sp.]|jgi:RimJ/RimL family protein N-acetyltransferase|nr:GNAT family N-acetyltransferase [Usitatibacter sp.]